MTDDLTRPELRYLEAKRREAERKAAEDDRPSRSLQGRMQRAVDKWSTEASWIALGLAGATVTLPPSRKPGGHTGRSSGPSDPTAAQLYATLDAATRDANAWAHLTGPCSLDGLRVKDGELHDQGMIHECPDGSAVDVADMLGLVLDPEEIVDGLMGTPPSSARTFEAIAHRAASWHSQSAVEVMAAWRQAWRDGAEPSQLDSWTTSTEELARRMAALAGRLADWSGRTERQCSCGCGKPAPPKGEGATRSGCRTRMQRERDAG